MSTINKFADKFPNFNISLLQDYNDPKHFYLEDIKDEFAKKILLEKAVVSEDKVDDYVFNMIVDQIQLCYPRRIESYKSLLHRINDVRKIINNIIHSNYSYPISNLLSEDSKIVVISHGKLIKFWTGKWENPLEEYDEIPVPFDYKSLKNCEFCSDEKYY